MKKTLIFFGFAIVILSISLVYLLFSLIMVKKDLAAITGRLWYDDGRIFILESKETGYDMATDILIGQSLAIDFFVFANFPYPNQADCASINKYFFNSERAVSLASGGKRWVNSDGTYSTDNTVFLKAFENLRLKYKQNFARLSLISKVEQCFLQNENY